MRKYSTVEKMSLELKHLDSFLALLLSVFDWVFSFTSRVRKVDYLIPEVFFKLLSLVEKGM